MYILQRVYGFTLQNTPAVLADRLAGVDGTLHVDSPENAGTVVSVFIPLGKHS